MLSDLVFYECAITSVITEINAQLASMTGEFSRVRLELDMTPTEYLIRPDTPATHAAGTRLISKWKGKVHYVQSLDDLSGVSFRFDEGSLADLVGWIRRGQSEGDPFIVFHPYVKGDTIVLRPGPPTVECRGYRVLRALLEKVRSEDGVGTIIPVPAFFCERDWETNWMTWIESSQILLRIGTSDKMDRFERQFVEWHRILKPFRGD
jgi:hypothetical protein